jgi:hypothetical protein
MKQIIKSIAILSFVALISSCAKDEGKDPYIKFIYSTGYTSADATIAKGSSIMIGITSAKAEEEDVLKKFNISKTVNGGAAVSVYDTDLSGADGDSYTHTYTTTLDTVSGQKNNYTFTITNRDGLTNQVSLTVTTQ